MVNFWRGKKVFLTGHTGFKGCWLSLWLQQMKAEVIGYALSPPTDVNLFTEANVAKGIVDLRGDIKDYQALSDTIQQHQPDIIIHMAAQSLVRHSYTFPIETYSTNVMGTVHVLEAARQCKSVRAIVNVTTDKCYENQEWHWGYRENEAMGGYDPYSSSKGCSELVTSAYRNSFFNPSLHQAGLASARAGNVIGGGDWAKDRLIPDLVAASIDKRSLKIRYPNAVRPWQHVLEPLSGYLRLAERLYYEPAQYAEAWNFGPNDADAKTVAWVADEVLKRWGDGQTWQLTEDAEVHEAKYLKLDCSKARTQLGWVPKWDIHQALAATVDWYQAYCRGADVRAFTLGQIEQYMTA